MNVYAEEIKLSFSGRMVLKKLSMYIPSGSFTVLHGNNGAGKTVLLEVIAGIHEAQGGRVLMDNRPVDATPSFQRSIFYVPQVPHKFWSLLDSRLFCFEPDRPVYENVISIRPGLLSKARGLRYLKTFGLTGEVAKKPADLSFGMQQRLALLRAFLSGARVLLLDEPLSSVDEEDRPRLFDLIYRLHRSMGKTILYVTHEPSDTAGYEALYYNLLHGKTVRAPAPKAPLTGDPPPHAGIGASFARLTYDYLSDTMGLTSKATSGLADALPDPIEWMHRLADILRRGSAALSTGTTDGSETAESGRMEIDEAREKAGFDLFPSDFDLDSLGKDPSGEEES